MLRSASALVVALLAVSVSAHAALQRETPRSEVPGMIAIDFGAVILDGHVEGDDIGAWRSQLRWWRYYMFRPRNFEPSPTVSPPPNGPDWSMRRHDSQDIQPVGFPRGESPANAFCSALVPALKALCPK